MAINFTDSPADGATFTQGAVNFTYDSTKGVWNRSILAAAISTYATLANMPLANVEDDTIARVIDTDKLYIWNGTGWYFLPPTNTNPTITTGGATSYDLAADGTATVVTLEANDPEGFAIIWDYSVTAGSLGSTAVVSVSNNVFTITPSTNRVNAGNFSLTFTASDGVNLSTSVSEFTLLFSIANSNSTLLNLQAVAAGDNSTFVDASSDTNTITNSGAIAGVFSPYRDQGYSAHFGNDEQGISIPATSHFGIQGSDFCIEMWVKPTSKIDPYPRLIQGGSASWGTNDSWTILAGHSDADHGSGTKYSFAAVSISGNNAVLRSTTSIDFGGDWQHVCVTRNGSTFSMYINGTREDTATTSSNLNSSATNALYLGENSSSDSSYHGYMSDVRVIKGSAFRDVSGSGSFDVPTEKLTNVSGTGYTTSLLACQGNTFKDYGDGDLSLAVQTGVTLKPLTPYVSVLEYSETTHGASGYFDGNDNIRSTTVDLPTGGEAYTIEAWIYATSTARGTIANWGAQGTGQATSLRLNDAGNGFSHIWYAANLETGDIKVIPNVWYHVAGTYDGTTRRIFVNGVQEAQDTPGNHNTSVTTNFTIGEAFYSGSNYMNGYLSGIRISDTARYSSGFSVPTAPHTADANTVFLLNPNPSVIDKSQRSNITFVGDASGSNTEQLFSTSTLYLDGNDYAIVDKDAGILGAGDFTVEAWYKNDSSSGNYRTIIEKGIVGGTPQNGAWSLGTRAGSDGMWFAYYNSGFTDLTATSVNPNDGSWHHLSVARSGSTFKMFFDGVQVHSSTLTASLGDFTNQNVNIGFNTRNSTYIKGYLQDVRVTKGLARYTSTFTPPTELLLG